MLKVEIKAPTFKEVDFRQALVNACVLVETTAKEKVPAPTGTLKRSITHEIKGNTGIVGTNMEYAPYVEYGTGLFATNGDGRKTPWRYQSADGQWHTTSGMSAQPFLGPALEENRDEIVKLFREAIKEQS